MRCKWCKGSEPCDSCWELEARLMRRPEVSVRMAAELLGMTRYAEFEKLVSERDAGNLVRWGVQGKLLLIAALTEEIGEVAQAVLDLSGTTSELRRLQVMRVREEIVDAAAVLRRLYDQADEYDPEGSAL